MAAAKPYDATVSVSGTVATRAEHFNPLEQRLHAAVLGRRLSVGEEVLEVPERRGDLARALETRPPWLAAL